MHTGIATSSPASIIATGGSPTPAVIIAWITDSAVSAPTMTSSPWAKLMSPMMP
jgi:hypothetical protein